MTPKSSIAKAISRVFGVADHYRTITAGAPRSETLNSPRLQWMDRDLSNGRNMSVQCLIQRDKRTKSLIVSSVFIFDDFPFYDSPSIDYLLGSQK